eukprot:GSMAST32.ASY1.ANO1.1015.1 assembled CDS
MSAQQKNSGPRRCENCNSMDIDKKDGGDELVCYSCGTVFEENTLINSVEFNDTAGEAFGHFVGAICTSVNINTQSSISEQAMRLFLLAVNHNFIQGRKTTDVCAVCVYMYVLLYFFFFGFFVRNFVPNKTFLDFFF